MNTFKASFKNVRVGLAMVITVVCGMVMTPWCVGQPRPGGDMQRHGQEGDSLVEIKIVHGKLLNTAEEATLSNVVSYLQTSAGANIVMPTELGGIRIGDLELRDSPVYLALQALALAGGNQFVFEERKDNMNRVGPDAKPLFMIEKVNPPAPPPAPAPPTEASVEAFSLTGYLSTMKLDEVSMEPELKAGTNFAKIRAKYEAIKSLRNVICETFNSEQAYNTPSSATGPVPGGTNTDGKSLEVKFFDDADLLIVIGPWNGVQAARTIIHALPGQGANANPGMMAIPR